MPSNIIVINGVGEFIVPDSKMWGLLMWIKKYGSPQNDDAIKILEEVN